MLLRIAIVDDLPQDAERLQQALTAEGQTNIIRYESGDALLSAISPEQLDALFLDICMEGTNGIDTARKLREQRGTGGGDVVDQTRQTALALGLHRHHEAAVPLGDDVVLQDLGIAGGRDDLLQNLPAFCQRRPHVTANVRQLRAGGVGLCVSRRCSAAPVG